MTKHFSFCLKDYDYIPKEILTHPDLCDGEKIFYYFLVQLINLGENKFLYETNEDLSKKSGFTHRSVKKYITKLAAVNLIYVNIERGKKRTIWLPKSTPIPLNRPPLNYRGMDGVLSCLNNDRPTEGKLDRF